MDSTIAVISRAEKMLSEVSSFSDILAVENLAARARDLAKAAGAGRDIVNTATKIMLDARRMAGKTLTEMRVRGELTEGKPPKLSQRGTVKLDDLGLTRNQSSRYQQEASVPDDVYQGWVVGVKEQSDGHLTASGLRKLSARQPTEVGDVIKQAPDGCEVVTQLSDLTERKFGCVYADPPWRYSNQQTRAATDNHYDTLTVDELCQWPVVDYVADDAHLHLWTTNAFLFDSARIIEAWGFEYKSCFVWVKPQMGIGNYWRVSHEFLLLGVRGNATRFNDHSLTSWMSADRTGHSAKPEEVRGMIERASGGPYLELFGRRPAVGWTVLGNQVEQMLIGR